jgi:glycosyltransferase involved in cell wall biosynthesis
MAQKRLFVASDVGGHRELVEDGVTGILHKAGDAASLADKLGLLLNDAVLGQRLREAGRQFVERERNWTNSIANYQAAYAKMLA